MLRARPIRVLLVDDNALFRQTLRRALQAYLNIEVVGEAEDGEEAVSRAIHLQPTVVVMDVNMPKMDGITATRLIKAQNPGIVVVGLSVYLPEYYLYAIKKAGAFEILDKNGALTELYGALQRAVASVQPVLIIEETLTSDVEESKESATSSVTDSHSAKKPEI
jgi:DNA-binding NarL/FixJ family response regulator